MRKLTIFYICHSTNLRLLVKTSILEYQSELLAIVAFYYWCLIEPYLNTSSYVETPNGIESLHALKHTFADALNDRTDPSTQSTLPFLENPNSADIIAGPETAH